MADKQINTIADEIMSMFSILIAKFFKLSFETRQKKKISRILIDALMIIDNCNEKQMTMSDIGRRLDIKKPNVTRLADKLCELKLVNRINNENDRRKIFIELSKTGKEFLADYKKEFKNLLIDILKKLKKANIEHIKEIIKIGKRIFTNN